MARKHRNVILDREAEAHARRTERYFKHQELLNQHKKHKGQPIDQKVEEDLAEYAMENMDG